MKKLKAKSPPVKPVVAIKGKKTPKGLAVTKKKGFLPNPGGPPTGRM